MGTDVAVVCVPVTTKEQLPGETRERMEGMEEMEGSRKAPGVASQSGVPEPCCSGGRETFGQMSQRRIWKVGFASSCSKKRSGEAFSDTSFPLPPVIFFNWKQWNSWFHSKEITKDSDKPVTLENLFHSRVKEMVSCIMV